jgi:hypothetical protein
MLLSSFLNFEPISISFLASRIFPLYEVDGHERFKDAEYGMKAMDMDLNWKDSTEVHLERIKSN